MRSERESWPNRQAGSGEEARAVAEIVADHAAHLARRLRDASASPGGAASPGAPGGSGGHWILG